MDIGLWIKQHKALAAIGGGGALLFMMHKGHSSGGDGGTVADSTGGTVDPATNTEVQLVPVSTSPAEQAGGNLDVPNPSDPNIASSSSMQPFDGVPTPISIGGDLNSPLVGSGGNPPADPETSNPSTPVNGVAQNGNASTAAAVAAATRPHGHPGYKTVVEHSKKSPTHKEFHHVYEKHGKVVRDVAVKPAPAAAKVTKPVSKPKVRAASAPHPVSSVRKEDTRRKRRR